MSSLHTPEPRPTDRALARAARDALALFDVSPRAQIRRLHDGENTVWRVQPPRGRQPLVLRLHRAGYQPPDRIEGELAWLDALARDTPGLAPQPQRSRDGRRIHSVSIAGTPQVRPASLLSWTAGRFTPFPGHANALHQLGTLTSRLHRHSYTWRSRLKERRPLLGFDEQVGRACHWGIAPISVPGLRKKQRDYLAGTVRALRARVGTWDVGNRTRGLVHADIHLGNVLFDDGVARAIDFDDCARTWYLMDPAVTLLPAALQDGFEKRRDAYWAGYTEHGGLIPPADFEHLATFQLIRIVTMFAWSWTRSDNARMKAYHATRQKRMLAACRVWNRSAGIRIR